MDDSLPTLTNFLFEIGTLRKILRSHSQTLLTGDASDNIASHSFRVTMIGYFLAQLEKADANKVVMMCLFHDTGEARSGDQNWVHKKYVKTFEDEITKDQLLDLPMDEQTRKLIDEYSERKSLESKVAKDADLLDQILLLKEYAHMGNKEAQKWLDSKEQGLRLFTKSAQDLMAQIYKTDPGDWWSNIWTSERR